MFKKKKKEKRKKKEKKKKDVTIKNQHKFTIGPFLPWPSASNHKVVTT